jgi:hypothetical protein
MVLLDMDGFVGGKRTAGKVTVNINSAVKYLRASDVYCTSIVHCKKGFKRFVGLIIIMVVGIQ